MPTNTLPFILFKISSPYFKSLKASWTRNRLKLIDTTDQLAFILEQTRTDVYNQFTEKQGEWRSLAEYTVKKKAAAKSDSRILHESKGDARLKDAYYVVGTVDNQKLIYHYPASKPYAREHQEGAVIDNPSQAKSGRKKGRKTSLETRSDKLDTEFLTRFGIQSFADLFD